MKGPQASFSGWDRLSHEGLLLDPTRLQELAKYTPGPLNDYTVGQLRLRASALTDDSADTRAFVTFVLEQVCGLDAATGTWLRGSAVPPAERRRTASGESVKPDHLWKGIRGARLPVFIDDSKRLGVGRSRRLVSQATGYLRAGNEHLALLTNGRQWRLLFAGLDYEARCDWDTDLWFEEGELSEQVAALRTLLNAKVWTPESDGATPALLQAIRDTRKGQAELSEVLGERVREAVEILIRGHGDMLASISHAAVGAAPTEIYRAGCRIAMRLVVILFAESRKLLPRDNALYDDSYGLNGLFERLERDAAQGRAMRETYSAWPRVLALFKLVYEGSHHPDLPVTRYGGELFAPGVAGTPDGLSNALAVFETASLATNVLPDADVHEMLKLLTRTTMRIRQGKATTRTTVPVDFSDLSSEYIGILYEGLLDYELKTAPADDPVVFLATGDQPALPLARLEAMDARALKALFASFKEGSSESGTDAEVDDANEDAPSDQPPLDEAADERGRYVVSTDERQESRERAERWARKAVEAAGLVSKRGKDTPERQLRLRNEIGRKARQLVARIVLPGEWYLVRWGGTRKGSGSFYTRPGLTIPTVQRTLRPLAYDPPKRTDGTPNLDAPVVRWTPRRPEQILELTVCDPACGSGSFPLAALRFLTDAVYAALQFHKRIEPADAHHSLVHLLGVGDDRPGALSEEKIPCPPDDEHFEERTKAVLRRHVVERCIYAVDLDPLAVELCRLSLWIETMDRSLPFGFLDHKVKCGNSLIGAWFDEFAHYPAMAWKNREGGDKSHSNGVHFEKNARTKAIKAFVNETLKPELRLVLQGEDLFQADALALAASTHAQAMGVINEMHELPVQNTDERAALYRDGLLASDEWSSLKGAMDLWTACWFWPSDSIDAAPSPQTFIYPSDETRAVAGRVAADMRFFHWELEYPDVFRQGNGEGAAGFDAILGNPPWDIAKPVSKEFFSNIDPLYRSYGKQEALRRQKGYFDNDEAIERDWLDYNARFRAQSNYMSYTGNPFGDPDQAKKKSQAKFSVAQGRANQDLHERWRAVRARSTGFADPVHPYRHQGSADLNLYKLFLEKAHALLGPQGRLGFLVPSGLYSDHGTGALRSLFLERCRWEWLFGVENRDGIFPIHRSYKFNPIIVQKGGKTDAINTAFMRRKLEDWERAEDMATPYTRKQVERFSPNSRAILEIQSARDLEILEKIYANGVLLGDDGPDGWGIKYATEFHMTNDSHLFPPRPEWEAKGYRPDEYSRWLLGDWRPMEELWEMLGVDPTKPEPAEIGLEDWLFDTTAGPERREAEAQFVHGHWLKPGDVARTDWKLRCAQPPYDRLPVPRVQIPAGIVLSREGDAWIHEDRIQGTAYPLMQGVMVQPFFPSARRWLTGTGAKAKWAPAEPHDATYDPQYLMSSEDLEHDQGRSVKLGFRNVSRDTDARSFIGALLPHFPCGHSLPLLHARDDSKAMDLGLLTLLNSFVFDWLVRERGGGVNLTWGILREVALPQPDVAHPFVNDSAAKLNPWAGTSTSTLANLIETRPHAISLAERVRVKAAADAVVASLYGLTTDDLAHVLSGTDLPASRISLDRDQLDPRGFWRVDKVAEPQLRHTVLTIIAFHDLQSKVREANGDWRQGIERFLSQNRGDGWLIPETVALADYGLSSDDTGQRQICARNLGPRLLDWQLAQSAERSCQEDLLHMRNRLGAVRFADHSIDLPVAAALSEEARTALVAWRSNESAPFDGDIGDTTQQELHRRDLQTRAEDHSGQVRVASDVQGKAKGRPGKRQARLIE